MVSLLISLISIFLFNSGSCSAIAAMSIKGVEVVSMHEKIIDGDTYLRVLDEFILPLMNPFPLEKSVLFNDNAPVHNKAAIITLCQTYGFIAVFLNRIVMITILSNLPFTVPRNTVVYIFPPTIRIFLSLLVSPPIHRVCHPLFVILEQTPCYLCYPRFPHLSFIVK